MPRFVLEDEDDSIQVITLSLTDEGGVDVKVGENYVLGFQRDGTVLRYGGIDEGTGLKLDAQQRVKLVTE